MKRCSKCLIELPAAEFHAYARSRDGLQSQCKTCSKRSRVAWDAKNPEKARAQRQRSYYRNQTANQIRSKEYRLSRFGLTPAQYAEMLQTQGGVCPVCSLPPLPDQRLAVDHDHACCDGDFSCGLCVRGLLHSACNRAIGILKDDPNVLLAAAAYLIQYEVSCGNAR